MKYGRSVLRVIGVLALAFLLLEAMARIGGVEPLHINEGRVRRPVQRCMEWPVAGGGSVTQCTNALGLVGPLPGSDDRRVIALGSSTTECPYMSEEETWPVRLQRALEARGLHVWVGNAGVSGSTAVGQAIYLEDRLLDLGPELVLFMPGANDRRPLDPRQDAGMLAPDRTPWHTALIRHSRMLTWLARSLTRRGVAVPQRSELDARACTDTGLNMDTHAQLQADYRQRLMRVIDRCRMNGVGLVVITQPTGCSADAPVHAVMERYNTTVREVAAEQRLALVDLARAEWARDTCFLDAIHFSAAGAARVSQLLAPALERILAERLTAPSARPQ
ncbi:MAG: SGNH/GDSL hydrolase family protein [Flavobacteriales bacterium]